MRPGPTALKRLAVAVVGLVAVVLLGSLGVLATSALQSAEREQELRHRLVADRVFDELERELSDLLVREEGRPFAHYTYYYVPSEAVSATGFSRSPLSRQPASDHVIGWFQIDPEGHLSSPMRPNLRVPGDAAPELDEAELERLEAELGRHTAGLGGWGGPPLPDTEAQLLVEVSRERVRSPDTLAMAKPGVGKSLVSKADLGSKVAASKAPPEPLLAKGDTPDEYEGIQRALNRGASQRADRKAQWVNTSAGNVDNFLNPELLQQKLEPLANEPGVTEPVVTDPVADPAQPEPQAPQAIAPSRPAPGVVVERVVMAPAPAPAPTEVEVEVSPLTCEPDDTGALVLHRSVRIGPRTWVQGVVLDPGKLTASLAGAVVGPELDDFVDLTWSPGQAAEGPYRFEHVFAEPFDDLAASVTVAALPDGTTSPSRTLAVLSVVTVLVVLLGLTAVVLMLRAAVAYGRQRADFVSAITHELKTPLTAIRLHAEMLEQGMVPGDERKHRYYGTIRSESERLSRLVDNVLEFSRLERRAPAGDAARASLGSVLDELQPLYALAEHQLVVTVDPEVAAVEVDADALRQVLVNLVDNAIKFSPGADPREVVVTARSVPGGTLLTVRDHGPGAPAGLLRRMFRPFVRGEDELTRQTKGTGIGLALVHGLVQRMGGQITARNHAEGGLVLEIRLQPGS